MFGEAAVCSEVLTELQMDMVAVYEVHCQS